MSGSYALIKNGIVENTIVADDTFKPLDEYILVSIEGLTVSIGDSWDGKEFTTTLPAIDIIEEPVDPEKAAIMEAIIDLTNEIEEIKNKLNGGN